VGVGRFGKKPRLHTHLRPVSLTGKAHFGRVSWKFIISVMCSARSLMVAPLRHSDFNVDPRGRTAGNYRRELFGLLSNAPLIAARRLAACEHPIRSIGEPEGWSFCHIGKARQGVRKTHHESLDRQCFTKAPQYSDIQEPRRVRRSRQGMVKGRASLWTLRCERHNAPRRMRNLSVPDIHVVCRCKCVPTARHICADPRALFA
jgi:hypothetical protein